MISSKHNFIFIHIPKTGGSSVVDIFRKFHNSDEQIETAHQTISGLKKRYLHCIEYDILSVIRNPYERMISYFFHMKLRDKDGFRSFTKEGFVNFLLKGHIDKIWKPFPSQISFFNGEKINLIRFENFKEELKPILNKYGIDEPIPKINTTKHKHYSYYYDNETRAIIEDLYKDDLKEFGYKFETG